MAEEPEIVTTIRPKNWASFQHYKDRAPPWIKLHHDLLDNYDFHCLPVASKALAPLLWLIASEHEGGIINADPSALVFRLRMTQEELGDALHPLVSKGFFIVETGTLAECYPDASKTQAKCPPSRGEERRGREETDRFSEFWMAYPRKVAKADAEKAWRKISAATVDLILADLATREWDAPKFIPHPATYLNAKRWEDAATTPVNAWGAVR